MRSLVAIAVVALVALVFAVSAMSGRDQPRSMVTARGSAYGQILFDRRGFALYAFTRDAAGHSACSGACARAWPPYLVSKKPSPGRGVKASLLGTARRRDGSKQATYAGKPLYYYVGDREPLQVLCQDVSEFGGRWLVVRPNGTLVR